MEFRNPPVGVTGCLSHPAWAGVPSLSWGWCVVPGPPRGLRDNAPQESGCQGSQRRPGSRQGAVRWWSGEDRMGSCSKGSCLDSGEWLAALSYPRTRRVWESHTGARCCPLAPSAGSPSPQSSFSFPPISPASLSLRGELVPNADSLGCTEGESGALPTHLAVSGAQSVGMTRVPSRAPARPPLGLFTMPVSGPGLPHTLDR